MVNETEENQKDQVRLVRRLSVIDIAAISDISIVVVEVHE